MFAILSRKQNIKAAKIAVIEYIILGILTITIITFYNCGSIPGLVVRQSIDSVVEDH